MGRFPQEGLSGLQSLLHVSFFTNLGQPPPGGPEMVVLTPVQKRSFLYYRLYYKFHFLQILDIPVPGVQKLWF
jgi:hypothetical protein